MWSLLDGRGRRSKYGLVHALSDGSRLLKRRPSCSRGGHRLNRCEEVALGSIIIFFCQTVEPTRRGGCGQA